MTGQDEYIESMEDYCRIHLVNARPVMTLTTLKSLLEKLPPEKFKRIHRSYIISISKIDSVANKKIKLFKTELPISTSYLSEISQWLKK